MYNHVYTLREYHYSNNCRRGFCYIHSELHYNKHCGQDKTSPSLPLVQKPCLSISNTSLSVYCNIGTPVFKATLVYNYRTAHLFIGEAGIRLLTEGEGLPEEDPISPHIRR